MRAWWAAVVAGDGFAGQPRLIPKHGAPDILIFPFHSPIVFSRKVFRSLLVGMGLRCVKAKQQDTVDFQHQVTGASWE